MALPMEELYIRLIIKRIMERDLAPWKQLIKVADRCATDRSDIMAPRWALLRQGVKALAMNFKKTRPRYIFGVKDVFMFFFHRKEIKSE